MLLPGGVNGVFIPRQAVVRDKTTDSNQVYAIQRGGKARLASRLGGRYERRRAVRILTGIADGEIVATNNQAGLYDGVPVITR